MTIPHRLLCRILSRTAARLSPWAMALALCLTMAQTGRAQIAPTPAIAAEACAYNPALPTLTAGAFGLVQCDSAGRWILSPSTALTANQGAPNTIPNAWPVTLAQAGAALSPTNPIFAQVTNLGLFPVQVSTSLPAGTNTLGYVIALPGTCTTTQTIVSGTGGALLAANPNRRSLRWMNIGAADITVAPSATTPTVGQGMIYASTAAGKQGGSESFYDSSIASNAFSYSAATAATIVVWECQ